MSGGQGESNISVLTVYIISKVSDKHQSQAAMCGRNIAAPQWGVSRTRVRQLGLFYETEVQRRETDQ